MVTQKIAFCFLTYDDIEQQDVWRSFFAAADPTLYAIYMHSSNGLIQSSLAGTNLIPRQDSAWGKFSLLEVHQSLFDAAYLDPSITKFILVSGDTIPLYSFATIYAAMTRDDKGYINYKQIQRSDKLKINEAAWPRDDPLVWSTTSQWATLNRKHVSLLHDNMYILKDVFQGTSIADEHVYSMFFNAIDELASFHLFSHINVNWDIPKNPYADLRKKCPTRCSIAHRKKPWTYHSADLCPRMIQKIYSGKGFFVRKICKLMRPIIDWNSERILIG